MSTSTSRVILFLTVIVVACMYLVSAAPIVSNDLAAQLELANVVVPHINVFKKHDDEVAEYDEDNEDNEDDKDNEKKHGKHDDDEEEEEETTTTTATATSTKYHKTTSTEEATTTTKSSKSTKTTTTDEPTATAASKKQSSGGSHSGEATYYGVGLGSCGKTNKDSDMIVALNHGQMSNGANPNHNDLCGKTITAKGPKGSVTVTIVDTCPGCATGDLDLSPAAFSKIADMAKGRVPITWSFN